MTSSFYALRLSVVFLLRHRADLFPALEPSQAYPLASSFPLFIAPLGTLTFYQAETTFGKGYREGGGDPNRELDLFFCFASPDEFDSDSQPTFNWLQRADHCLWYTDKHDNWPQGEKSVLRARGGGAAALPDSLPIPATVDKAIHIPDGTATYRIASIDVGRDGDDNALNILINASTVPTNSAEVFDWLMETDDAVCNNCHKVEYSLPDALAVRIALYYAFTLNGCTDTSECGKGQSCFLQKCRCNAGYTTISDKGEALACEDTTPPTITLLGFPFYTLEAGVNLTFADPGVDATDNGEIVEQTVTGYSELQAALTAHHIGDFVIKYTVVDLFNNSASVTRTVLVTDSQPPSLTQLAADHHCRSRRCFIFC